MDADAAIGALYSAPRVFEIYAKFGVTSINGDAILAVAPDISSAFAPRFGYLEDPATGSGNAAFGYHLLASGAWFQGRLLIEQNGSLDNPNFVSLALEEHGGERPTLVLGGGARVKIHGEYFPHEAPLTPELVEDSKMVSGNGPG